MASNNVNPKRQREISQNSITSYKAEGYQSSKSNLEQGKKREYQRSVKDDDVSKFKIGLRDIDEAIFYYFNKVIKPSVIQNGLKKDVPVIYGSPERWSAVQKDGFYRDKNGKIQLPLIMVKRDSVTKNRNLGNKLDANNPINFGIFEKKYSAKNQYDRFSLLNNRIQTKEYQGVVIPDYVDLSYSCIIFTEYVEQMNKLVESINYASDAYWGDPEKFNFRAMIDNYTTSTELVQGQDRSVKTSFEIKLLGHVIPDAINTNLQGSSKFFSKSAVIFGLETVSDINNLDTTDGSTESSTVANNRGTPARLDGSRSRFYDNVAGDLTVNFEQSSMTGDQKEYTTLQKIISSNGTNITVTSDTVTFQGTSFKTPPAGFPDPPVKESFQVFINGVIVESGAITSITDTGSGVAVVFDVNELNYQLETSDEYSIIGKFN